MQDEDLPPKDPALFALGILVEAWFSVQKPRMQARFIMALRELTSQDVALSFRKTINWLSRLCDNLEKRAKRA